jgi:hypothetical protein
MRRFESVANFLGNMYGYGLLIKTGFWESKRNLPHILHNYICKSKLLEESTYKLWIALIILFNRLLHDCHTIRMI